MITETSRRAGGFGRYGVGVSLVLTVAALTAFAVRRWHTPGQLDVLSAQAMDMSQMRPPTGAALVQLAAVRRGALGDTVTYTGTIQAYNTQDISPRVTGQLLSLPVYPGLRVKAGQVVAQLDRAEVEAKAEQAAAEVRGAEQTRRIAELSHSLLKRSALEQADGQIGAAEAGVADAQAGASASEDAIADAGAMVASARASADYWRTEIAREKQLADAGAASRQEYQQELSQARAAQAALASAQSKQAEAQSLSVAARAKFRQAQRGVDVANAARRMAAADLVLAQEQAIQAGTGVAASRAAARQADVVAGYTRIVAPVSGVVTERPAAPGTLVQPGTVLLRIAEIDRVRVQAHVAVSDLDGVAVGDAVQITAQGAAGGKPFPARVTSVFPAADALSRTAIVEAVVPNPRHILLPGGFATMRLQKRAAPGSLLVPAAAIVYGGGSPSVFVASGGKSAATSAAEPREYECAVCHMRYSAADAKKHGYRDPMDGGKLVPVTAAAAPAVPSALAMRLFVRQVDVTVGASDGTSTAVSAPTLAAGDRVVIHGQAGLSGGAAVVAVDKWNSDGPSSLPTASQAMQGVTRYKCLVCGMTYSAEDAKKHGYKDPMDGGKLVPVTGGAQ